MSLNSDLRQEARKATNRCDRRKQRAKLRSNPSARYSVGEKVFVRLPGKAQKKRHLIEARIEKKSLKTQTYRVAYTSPVTGKSEKKWLPVDEVSPSGKKNVNKRLLSYPNGKNPAPRKVLFRNES